MVIRPTLKHHILDPIPVALDGSGRSWMQPRSLGKPADRVDEEVAVPFLIRFDVGGRLECFVSFGTAIECGVRFALELSVELMIAAFRFGQAIKIVIGRQW